MMVRQVVAVLQNGDFGSDRSLGCNAKTLLSLSLTKARFCVSGIICDLHKPPAGTEVNTIYRREISVWVTISIPAPQAAPSPAANIWF
jgi:hypothetical protein